MDASRRAAASLKRRARKTILVAMRAAARTRKAHLPHLAWPHPAWPDVATTRNALRELRQRELPPVYLMYGFAVMLSATAAYGLATQPGTVTLASGHQGDITSALKVGTLDGEPQHNQPAATKPATTKPDPAATEQPKKPDKAAEQPRQLTCGKDALGPGRLIKLDTQGGGQYGMVQFRDTLPLNDKEVVFTFDDGPHPTRTPQILDILDRYCIKAVFFVIGEMAERSPGLLREIERRGHVIGTHTWSHPLSLAFLSPARAEEQIEHGFAAVSTALGGPTAPFFRFPGLGQNKRLLDYLAERNIAVWSVDVVSGDSERASAQRIPTLVMSRLEPRGRGILLFHDIKKTTVEALPTVIEMLREEGYIAAQVVPAAPLPPNQELITKLQAHKEQRGNKQLLSLRQGRAKIR